MTSKTYSNKRGAAVFFTQLRALRITAALFLPLAMLIAAGVVGYMSHSVFRSYALYGEFSLSALVTQLQNADALYGTSVLGLMAIVAAFQSFGYLHSRTRVDKTHALPVRREVQFGGRVLACGLVLALGVLLVTVCESVSVVMAQGLALRYGEFTVDITAVIASLWGVFPAQLLGVLSIYLFAVMVIVLTATHWESVFSLVALTAAFPVASMVLTALVQSAVPHTAVFQGMNAFAFSPVGFALLAEHAADVNFTNCLVHLLQILVCGGIAFFAYKRRRSELAEDSVAPTRYRFVLRAIITTVMFAVGGLYGIVATGQYFAYWACAILAALVTHVIFEIAQHHSLKGLGKHILPLAVSAALFVLFNGALAVGLIGVPSLPKADTVEVAMLDYYGYSSSGDEMRNIAMNFTVNVDGEEERWNGATADAATVKRIYDLAQTLVEEEKAASFPYYPRGEYWSRGLEVNKMYASVSIAFFGETDSTFSFSLDDETRLEAVKKLAHSEDYATDRLEVMYRFIDGLSSVTRYPAEDASVYGEVDENGELVYSKADREFETVEIDDTVRSGLKDDLKAALLKDNMSGETGPYGAYDTYELRTANVGTFTMENGVLVETFGGLTPAKGKTATLSHNEEPVHLDAREYPHTVEVLKQLF